MSWARIFFIVYLFAGYFAVIRFRNHKYFYYLFALAAADPLMYWIQKFFQIDYFLYCSIVFVMILWAVPGLDYKKKIIATLGVALTLMHYTPNTLVSLIVWETIFLIILFTFLEEFKNQVRLHGEGSIFLLLLSLETVHNAVRVYLYIENISLVVSLHIWLLIINILLLVVIAILGPHAKTALNFIRYNSGSINGLSKKVIFDVAGNILLNHQQIPLAIPQSNEVFERKMNYDLTRTELKILDHLAQGLTNSEIADKCNVSKKTIENHLQHIREKLEMPSMLEVRKLVHK